LIYSYFQIGCPDPQDYPDDLDDIMGRKFAFRVKWQPGWGGQGSVVHCKDSQELVSKIQEHLPVAEVWFITLFRLQFILSNTSTYDKNNNVLWPKLVFLPHSLIPNLTFYISIPECCQRYRNRWWTSWRWYIPSWLTPNPS
jgi:hypothetical protein